MTHLQKPGIGFLVRVFGTGFWCVCHWHYTRVFCKHNIKVNMHSFANLIHGNSMIRPSCL